MYDADSSSRGGLKRQMVFYIVFQAAIFITMAVEITVFIRGEHVSGALRKIASTYAVPDSVVLAPVDLILIKVAIMLGVLLLTVALVMTLFIKRITIPLAETIEASMRIAEGDLSATVPVHFRDELGLLASSINDLSANYQEVLLLAQDLTRRARSAVPEADAASFENGQNLGELRETLAELDSMLEDFSSTFFRSQTSS